MGRKNQNTFIKKQKAEKRRKAKMEKMQKKEERKSQPSSGKLEDMMAYVDEDGNITTEPPEENVPNAPKVPKDPRDKKTD